MRNFILGLYLKYRQFVFIKQEEREVVIRNGTLTKHHILPRSRGGGNGRENLAWIGDKLHKKFHALFSNKTPTEAIVYLVKVFFNGNIGFLEQALTELKANSVSTKSIQFKKFAGFENVISYARARRRLRRMGWTPTNKVVEGEIFYPIVDFKEASKRLRKVS